MYFAPLIKEDDPVDRRGDSIKRNNILSCLLFILTALFPLLYLGRLLFLRDYTVLFERLTLWADILNVLLIGICTALLICKDKQIGRTPKVMLILSAVLLPVGRFLMARVLESSYLIPGTWSTVIYLVTFIVLVMTICFFIKNKESKVIAILLIVIIFTVGGSLDVISYVFSFQNPRTIAEIPSPDGVHHIRVIEYADDDNENWLYKAVFSYNSAESFSIGSIEFMKDRAYIEDYPEAENPHFRHRASLDENTDITFHDNGTITIKDITYTYSGEKVIAPDESPL